MNFYFCVILYASWGDYMGKCYRNFNTEHFKTWLSHLLENVEGVKFYREIDEEMERYSYLYHDLLGEIVIYNDILVEEIITDQRTGELVFYLHYEMEDGFQVVDLVETFKNRMFCVCQNEYEITEDDTERNILLCCSSALTTTMFADMLEKYSEDNHLPYHFTAASIYDNETLSSQNYDLILMAPQVQYHTKDTAQMYHKRFLNIDPGDYASYNCRNIISRVQEVFI